MGRVLGVIPARLGSERLPRKPLQLLAGRPLIEWVWRKVVTFAVLDHVVVATDSDEVAGVCYAFGADVELTSAHHDSGTERVAEVAARPAYADCSIIVNIQGDEPFIADQHVLASVDMVRRGFDIGTAAAPITSAQDAQDPSIVKIARAENGRALYFSRAAIPFPRDGQAEFAGPARSTYLRHVGVYACSREALLQWTALPATGLERIEKLEQLRPLAAGLTIGVALVGEAQGGIDTPADLERAERMMKATTL